MSSRSLLAGLIVLGLAGCSGLPNGALPQASQQDRPWPQLMPTDALLAQAGGFSVSDDDTRSLQARAAALRARADRLRRRQP